MGGSFNQDYRSAQVQDGWPSIFICACGPAVYTSTTWLGLQARSSIHSTTRLGLQRAMQYTFHDMVWTSKAYILSLQFKA